MYIRRNTKIRLLVVSFETMLVIFAICFAYLSPTLGNASIADYQSQIGIMGTIGLNVDNIPPISTSFFQHSSSSPIIELGSPLHFAEMEIRMKKVINNVYPGAPPDTFSAAIRLLLPDGSNCWLMCSIGAIDSVGIRTTTLLGTVYECSTSRLWESVAASIGKPLEVILTTDDFMPAFIKMLENSHESCRPPEVFVVGVYPLAETKLTNKGQVVISASAAGFLGWCGCTMSSIEIDGTSIPVIGGVSSIEGIDGDHKVKVTVSGRFSFIPISGSAEFTLKF